MSQAPTDRKYSAEHQWAYAETEGVFTVGITDYAQETLGDLVFLQLPERGTQVRAHDVVATVESVKTASDIYAPMSGTIIDTNDALHDAPERINENAYTAWLFKIEASNPAEYDQLLTSADYLSSAT